MSKELRYAIVVLAAWVGVVAFVLNAIRGSMPALP